MTKKVLRIIKHFADTAHACQLLRNLKFIPLKCMYMYCCLLHLKEAYELEVHTYSNRRNVMLDIVAARLENTNHVCMKIVLLNKLPDNAWPISISTYKTNVSKWFKYQ